jgi:pyruvate formate lyase activating enzyme
MAGERHVLDRSVCVVCGECAKECYSGALEVVGREVTAGEALATVLRDRPFYETSGGGMTLSGGEPLAQIDFAEALLSGAKRAALHCCVETCGFAPFAHFERIMPLVDLFLFDLKETDERRHQDFTGVSNRPILDNLRLLRRAGATIRLRIPLVPGCNDHAGFLESVARLTAEMPGLQGVEILPYHRLGLSKRERLGLEIAGEASLAPPSPEDLATVEQALERLGVRLVR